MTKAEGLEAPAMRKRDMEQQDGNWRHGTTSHLLEHVPGGGKKITCI